MAFTIFYAWQMDREKSVNRYFIEAAIKKAIKAIKADIKTEPNENDALKFEDSPPVEAGEEAATNPEPDNDDADIVYVWGAHGSTGANLIAETILDRISKCGVFVGDLTFVTQIKTADDRDKWLPNANVLLETGAASQTGSGWNRMVLVLNTAFGSVEALPFDLKHRRCTVQYDLASKADPLRKAKLQTLADSFVSQIKPMYEEAMERMAEEKRRITDGALATARIRAEKARHFDSLLSYILRRTSSIGEGMGFCVNQFVLFLHKCKPQVPVNTSPTIG